MHSESDLVNITFKEVTVTTEERINVETTGAEKLFKGYDHS